MNNSEKMLYLSSKLMMLSLDREHNQKEIETVSEELAALQRQMTEAASQNDVINEDWDGFLKFTDQEILKMPKTFRKHSEFKAAQPTFGDVQQEDTGVHTKSDTQKSRITIHLYQPPV